MSESENAVKSQIWCAVASYVLIAIVKTKRRYSNPRILHH